MTTEPDEEETSPPAPMAPPPAPVQKVEEDTPTAAIVGFFVLVALAIGITVYFIM
jgi:uncharacterized protein HemX